ncbi:MAG: glycosyltransferase family 2 protein, partial [Methylococcales bacterium]
DVFITELGFQKIRYRQSTPEAMVSLIIPTKDRADLLRMSVGSILEKTDYPSFEIIIVNNQSSQEATSRYFREIAADKRVRVIDYDAEFNFSAINTFAARHARGVVLGLVNNDIEVINADWLTEMTSHAVRPGVGAVGAKLFYPDDTVQHAGVIIGLGGVAGHAYLGKNADYPGQASRACLTQNLSAVTAACLLIRKNVFDEVGGLDESLKVAFNDVDFCLRILRAGYRNVWTPFASLYHHESLSRGYEDTPEKRTRFQSEVLFMKNRWSEELDHDPAYNPNLTLNGNAFDLAYPPRVR